MDKWDKGYYQLGVFKGLDHRFAASVERSTAIGGMGWGYTEYWVYGDTIEELWNNFRKREER